MEGKKSLRQSREEGHGAGSRHAGWTERGGIAAAGGGYRLLRTDPRILAALHFRHLEFSDSVCSPRVWSKI